jgi:predicted AlkP superfamily phosphohydrolase/phosphomutase
MGVNETLERPRLLVVGLDGATWDLIKPWAQAGKLPFLARLMAEGTSLDLNSTVLPISPPAWASFMTGKNPGKHGVFDFTGRDWGSYRMRIMRRPLEPSFWSILSQNGCRVGIVNVPQTYPPEEVNGFVVTGLGTPSNTTFTYPPDLTASLHALGYQPTPDIHYRPGNERELLDSLLAATENTTRVATELMSREMCDLFVVVLRITDEAAHFFWKYMDETHPSYSPEDKAYRSAILTCYQKADNALSRIVEAAGEGVTLFVMSDHGAGPLYKDVFLNEWLRQEGLLVLKEKPTTSSLLVRLLLRSGLTRTTFGRTLSWMGLGRLKPRLRALLGERINIIPNDPRMRLHEAVDWSQTQAYSMGYIGQIYVNLKGRDPQGIVERGEAYEQLRSSIIERLLQLQDPQTGEKVVDKVIKKEEVYKGPYLEQAPDLFVYMKGLSYITRGSYDLAPAGTIFAPPSTHESGGHRQTGILLAWGKHIFSNRTIHETSPAEIVDLAPTILYLMGCAIPQDMDGQVITSLIEPDYISSHPIACVSPEGTAQKNNRYLTEEEEQELINRLKGLGYL